MVNTLRNDGVLYGFVLKLKSLDTKLFLFRIASKFLEYRGGEQDFRITFFFFETFTSSCFLDENTPEQKQWLADR